MLKMPTPLQYELLSSCLRLQKMTSDVHLMGHLKGKVIKEISIKQQSTWII